MINEFMNFSDAKEQGGYSVIPENTLVKVKLALKAGYHNEPEKGWTGGWATKNDKGSVYLKTEYHVVDGEYAGKKIWGLIGLHSEKGPDFKDMGRSFIKGMLESARGVNPKDNSMAANEKRAIKSFDDLVGLEFLGKVTVAEDHKGRDKNELKTTISLEHPRYREIMGIPNEQVGAVELGDEIPF